MQSSKMTHWNRSTLWMGSRYKNMTQTAWNRILSCSRRKTAKKHTIYGKKESIYICEKYPIQTKDIYIYTHHESLQSSHCQPTKIVASNIRIQRSTASHGQQGGATRRFGPSRSLYLTGGTNVDLRIDRHVTGGGNLWKSTTIKNKGGSFSKDDKNPTKIRVLRKETLSKKWWQRTSRVTFSPVTRDIHLVYAECSLINMHLEDMKSHLIDSTCKKWTRINT